MLRILLIILIYPIVGFAQTQTYSDEEINEYRLANNAYLYAKSIGSMDSVIKAIEKLQILLQKYPNTVVKNAIIGHLFDAHVLMYSSLALKNDIKRHSEYPVISDPERIKELGKLLIEMEPQHYNYHIVAEGIRKCGLYLDDALVYANEAIARLADYTNLHMPPYYYTLGRIYLELEDNDSAISYFSKSDSIIAHIPDNKYRYIDTKRIQETKNKIGLAMAHTQKGESERAIEIYRELYLNNLDYESLENSYRSSLVAHGMDSMQVEEKLKEERTKYLEDIAMQLKQKSINRLAPQFTLKDINDEDVSLIEFRDKIVILNFWAGWCAPCLAEMPILVDLQKEFSQFPVTIIAVNIDLNQSQIQYEKLISDNHINFIILKGNSSILSQYQVPPIPKTYLIDKNGYIRYEHSGTFDNLYQHLRLELTELLKE